MENQNVAETDKPCSGRPSMREQFKFNGWLAAAAVTYLVSLFLTRHYSTWSSELQVAVSLAPVLPGLLYLKSGLKLLKSMDELQRRIQLEAWMFALVGTVVVATVLNVLNAHGLGWRIFPHGLEIGGSYLTMFFMWCAGLTFSTRRYQ